MKTSHTHTKNLSARGPALQSNKCLCLLDRHESAELSELVEIAADLDADGLVNPANADRVKAACSNQFGDRSAGLGIIRRIEEHGALWRPVRCGTQRLGTQRAERLDEL